MTFLELQDAVIHGRFNTNLRTQIKRWITSEHEFVWNFAEWTFKRVTALEADAELAVTASDRTPTMPSAFAESLGLLNDAGDPLEFLAPPVFERWYTNPDASEGPPQHFTVVNRRLYLGPTPSDSATFYLPHRRTEFHLDVNGDVMAGAMSVDTDTPAWGDAHAEVLIAGARARGKKRQQDPTWQADEDERDRLLISMLADFSQDRGGGILQYGRDTL